MLYKSILVPIDLGQPDAADAMFEKATALLADGGKITVVNVVPDIPNYVTAEMPEGFIAQTIRASEAKLKALAEKSDVKADIKILSGQAPRAILALAEEKGIDLILVASHRPGLSDYLLGSTAARVVRHATCSVLVLR